MGQVINSAYSDIKDQIPIKCIEGEIVIRKTIKNRVIIVAVIIFLIMIALLVWYSLAIINNSNAESFSNIISIPEINNLIISGFQGLLSCTVTLFALYFTVFNQDTQTAMQIKNNMLLSVRPCIFIEAVGAVSYARMIKRNTLINRIEQDDNPYILVGDFDDTSDETEYSSVNIKIFNLGSNIARNISLANNTIFFPDIGSNNFIDAKMYICNAVQKNTYFLICYEDIYGNIYSQSFSLVTSKSKIVIHSTEPKMERNRKDGKNN